MVFKGFSVTPFLCVADTKIINARLISASLLTMIPKGNLSLPFWAFVASVFFLARGLFFNAEEEAAYREE